MTASHEPFKTKPKMPLTLDGRPTSPQSPTRTTVDDVNIHRQHRSINAPPPPTSGSSRPHRTQSSSALFYRPLRVPSVVREDDALSSPVIGSPRRPWASTAITRPGESAD